MYALNLDTDGRVLSATFDKYGAPNEPRVATLPDGNIADYRYIDGDYVYDPLAEKEENAKPTQEERITALENQIVSFEKSYAEGVNEA